MHTYHPDLQWDGDWRRGFSGGGGGRGVIFPSSSAEIPVDAGWLSQHTNNYIDKYTVYIPGRTD